ncbi:MAG: PilN domain-containing protein [Pseudomonadota bacterium]
MAESSFVAPSRRWPGWVAACVWAIAVGGGAVTALSLAEAHRQTGRAEKAEAHIAALQPTLVAAERASGSIPTEVEIRQLAADISRLNALAGTRHLDLAPLLDALEGALPASVWAQSLTYDVERGTLALSLLSRDEATLPGALTAIEALDALEDVILERQVRRQDGQDSLVQYDIRAVAR